MSEAVVRRSFEVDGPIDLRSTFRLGGLWGLATWRRSDATGAWYARRTDAGPATVCLRMGATRLHALAWGPGAARLLDDAPRIAGVGGPAVAGVEAVHDALTPRLTRLRNARLGWTGELYPWLVSTALGQLVTGQNSKRSTWAVARTFGEPAPGPRTDLWLMPPPRRLASLPYEAFHPLGIERHRAVLITRIADRADALERAVRMPFAEARAHLEQLVGVGPWTSGVVLGSALGDPDAVPWGDFHLANEVAFVLAGEPRADDARMAELLAPYAGQRGLVARVIKGSGVLAPRYGPRMAVRDPRAYD